MRLRGMVVVLAVLAAAGCATGAPAPQPLEVSADAAGWGGMAPLADGRYLVVHDNKSHEAGARLSAFDPAHDRMHVRPRAVVVQDWGHAEGPANDLEALCRLDGLDDEFLLMESGRRQGRFGRVFHVRVRGWQAQVLAVLPLPADPVGEPRADHEGLACQRRGQGQWRLLIGERGGHAPRARGSVRLGLYQAARRQIEWDAQALPVTVPGPWPAGQRVRDIADLALEADGTVWAVGAMDPGNAGPFRSTVWRLGRLDPDADALRLEPVPRNHWVLDGLKVEALALPQPGMSGVQLLVATDDEDYGGIWRPLAPAVSPRE